MNFKIIMMNLIVPILAVLVIGAITGGFRAKKKESIKSEVYESFVKIWNADEKEDEEDSFFQRLFYDVPSDIRVRKIQGVFQQVQTLYLQAAGPACDIKHSVSGSCFDHQQGMAAE